MAEEKKGYEHDLLPGQEGWTPELQTAVDTTSEYHPHGVTEKELGIRSSQDQARRAREQAFRLLSGDAVVEPIAGDKDE